MTAARTKAIRHAMGVRMGLNLAEKHLQAAYDLAVAEGEAAIADRIAAVQDALGVAHDLTSPAAVGVAALYGDEVTVYSGGDDKPDPDEPPPVP